MNNLNHQNGAKIASAIDKRIISVAKEVYNNSPNDKMCYGTIVSKLDGVFSVKINNNVYTKVKALRNVGNIKIGEVVHCLVPNNNYNNMVIIGVADGTLPDIEAQIKKEYVSYNFVPSPDSLTCSNNVNYSRDNNAILTASIPSDGWSYGAYSTNGYDACYLSYSPEQTNCYAMVGLSSSNDTSFSYSSIDYAIYTQSGGTLTIYENGTAIGDFGKYSSNDTLKIIYDGVNVLYFQNETLLRSTTHNGILFFATAFYNSGAVGGIKYGKSFSYPGIYANDEQIIGKWIDGKILYRKVFQYTQSITENVMTTIGSIGTAVDTVVRIDDTIRNSNNEWWSSEYHTQDGSRSIETRITKANGDVQFISYNENWGSPIINVIVEYTKQ